MFTQFYGNYLINNNLISKDQLIIGLEEKSNTRLKLGVLAINAGYMTAAQVEQINEAQKTVDKKFGTLAVEQGFLTEEKVKKLLSSQKTGYLLLGQALVDKGFLTNETFESSINEYKKEYAISEDNTDNSEDEMIAKMVEKLVNMPNSPTEYLYVEYINILLKDLIRFIGDDFSILPPSKYVEADSEVYKAVQSVNGIHSFKTAFYAPEDVFLKFVTRAIDEDLTTIDEYTQSGACDFLNITNGLYIVNISNKYNLELKLEPPYAEQGIGESEDKKVLQLKFAYTFGTVSFVITL